MPAPVPAQTAIYGFAAVIDGAIPNVLFAAETVSMGPTEPDGPTDDGVVMWIKTTPGSDLAELWIKDGS